MKLKQINFTQLRGRTVLLRLDLDDNIPSKNRGSIRFDSAVKTLKKLQNVDAKTVVIAHKGRPKHQEKSLSLKVAAKYLASKIKAGTLEFLEMQTIESTKNRIDAMVSGDILVLENLRFNPGEIENSEEFAKQLASLGEIYINDAFATLHRNHASITGIPKFLPSYIGPTIQWEIEKLQPIKTPTKTPFIVIIGGAKISSKLHPLKAFLKKADKVFVGGAIATTFAVAEGMNVEASMHHKEDIQHAKELSEYETLIIPKDIVVKTTDGKYRQTTYQEIQQGEAAVDIGPETIREIRKATINAKLLLWNGPVGIVEQKESRVGSDAVAHIMAEASKGKAYGVIGGGDTVDIPIELRLTDFIDHISTGGSAMLEYLAGEKLPGLEAIKKQI